MLYPTDDDITIRRRWGREKVRHLRLRPDVRRVGVLWCSLVWYEGIGAECRGGCGRHEPPHKFSGWGMSPAATYFTGARMRNPDTECKRHGTDVGGVVSFARRGRVEHWCGGLLGGVISEG